MLDSPLHPTFPLSPVDKTIITPSPKMIIIILTNTVEAHYEICCCVVTKSCLTLCDPMDCSPPGSSVHGISQARILQWVAISFSKESSRPRDWTCISCLAGRFFTTEPPGKPIIDNQNSRGGETLSICIWRQDTFPISSWYLNYF